MKHQYIVSHWQKGYGDGTTCLFRTEARNEWDRKVKEVCEEYKVQNRYCKTIVYDNITIFSFATDNGVGSWVENKILRTPIQIKYGIPEEVKNA